MPRCCVGGPDRPPRTRVFQHVLLTVHACHRHSTRVACLFRVTKWDPGYEHGLGCRGYPDRGVRNCLSANLTNGPRCCCACVCLSSLSRPPDVGRHGCTGVASVLSQVFEATVLLFRVSHICLRVALWDRRCAACSSKDSGSACAEQHSHSRRCAFCGRGAW